MSLCSERISISLNGIADNRLVSYRLSIVVYVYAPS